MPYLHPGDDGKTADLFVVDTILQGSNGYSNLQKMYSLKRDKDTLTVDAYLYIDETTTPKLAILHVKDYRWDPTYNYMSQDAPGMDSIIALPLNMPEIEMEKRLEKFSVELFSRADFMDGDDGMIQDPGPIHKRSP